MYLNYIVVVTEDITYFSLGVCGLTVLLFVAFEAQDLLLQIHSKFFSGQITFHSLTISKIT